MRPINERRIPTEVCRVEPEDVVPMGPFKFAWMCYMFMWMHR